MYLPVSTIKNQPENYFYLKQRDFTISEITVNPVYPTDLIVLALEKIVDNYPDFQMYNTSYFYEKITENDSTIQEIEAIIEILKSPYNSKEKDKLKFTHGHVNEEVKDSGLWNYMYFINGPYELLYSDIVKYPNDFLQVPDNLVDFLDEDYFKHYIYSFTDTCENIIKIKFNPNPETKRGVYKGEIILDRSSLAFMYFDFQYAEERLEKVYYTESTMEIQFRQNGIFIPDNYYRCRVEYAKFGNLWVLKYVTNEYGFLFQKYNTEPNQIMVVDKLYITDYSIEIKKISYFNQIAKDVNILKIVPKTDSIIWNNLKIKY